MLWGCDDSATAPLEADPAVPPTAVDQGRDSSLEVLQPLAEPVLPPGIRDMPPGQAMRMELVGYPSTLDVGVCFTQIANPGWMAVALPAPWLDRTSSGGMTGRDFVARWLRADPYWLYRLEVELPEEAWAEAEGRVALFQYRVSDQNGYVHRVARCAIPASQLAADHLSLRFSRGRSASPSEPAAAASSCSAALAVSTSFDAELQDMVTASDVDCPEGRCVCPAGTLGMMASIASGDVCECVIQGDGCYPIYELDPISADPYCQGFGTHYDWDLEDCVCMDPTHQMDELGDCQPTHPEEDDYTHEPCPDPSNPYCPPTGGGDGDPTNPPPPPPGDSMSVTLTLDPATVTPGGVTEVIVQVSPAQAGVPVEVWSAVGGLDPSCQIPIGVFGATTGTTNASGIFSTTYKAGLDVQDELISASVTNPDQEILVEQGSLTVRGTCNNQADRLVAEYSIRGAVAAPPCGMFQNHGEFAPFTWTEWTGGARGNPSAASGGYGLIMLGISYLVVHLQWHFDVTFGIESGYRSPCGNWAIEASSGSYHQLGKAADLWIQGLEDSYSTRLSIRDYVLATQIGWSYVYGNRMIHVDTEYR